MLKALMKKVNNSHEQMTNFCRDGNSKKKPNENARSLKKKKTSTQKKWYQR